jgi:hypothetical protein
MMKDDPALESASRQQLARRVDRRLVEVDPVHQHLRIPARDREGRMAVTTGDVGDPGGRIRLQPSMESWNRREPVAGQELLIEWACSPSLAFVCIGTVRRVGDAGARSECL